MEVVEQLGFFLFTVKVSAGGEVKEVVKVVLQPLASVTVAVYGPAPTLFMQLVGDGTEGVHE